MAAAAITRAFRILSPLLIPPFGSDDNIYLTHTQVLDADKYGHAAYAPGTPCCEAVCAAFGVRDPATGGVDRQKVRCARRGEGVWGRGCAAAAAGQWPLLLCLGCGGGGGGPPLLDAFQMAACDHTYDKCALSLGA